MKLIIVNLHEGLRDNKSKQVVPLNRQVCVDATAFWRRRIEQGHVQLIRTLADDEAAKANREQAVAETAALTPAPARRRKKAAKKAAAITTNAPKSEESEGR